MAPLKSHPRTGAPSIARLAGCPSVLVPSNARRSASGVTLALLVFLPSLVHAQSSVVWKTNYYAVGGATLREIHESFRQARLWKNKSSYDGQTDLAHLFPGTCAENSRREPGFAPRR